MFVRSQSFEHGEVGNTIGESFSLVNTGENLVSKDFLDRGKVLCYMQREFYLNMMGSVSDSSLLQVPVSTASRVLTRSILLVSESNVMCMGCYVTIRSC